MHTCSVNVFCEQLLTQLQHAVEVLPAAAHRTGRALVLAMAKAQAPDYTGTVRHILTTHGTARAPWLLYIARNESHRSALDRH